MNSAFRLLALFVFVVALVLGVAVETFATQPMTLGEVLGEDATLHDVTFIDTQRGWAVGDRGVVLHTDDGGVHWRTQPSGVDCPLLSVSFVSPERGWVVGGYATPLSHRTRGTVLRTIDGGRTWQRVQDTTLPRLTHVQFFDDAHGVATGYGSSFYPSGLFVTRDGGASWQPFATPKRTAWLAADFVDVNNGVVASARGSRGAIVDRKLELSMLTGADNRTVHSMAMANATQGWLVGDNGLVALTNDGGVSWQPPAVLPSASSQAAGAANQKADYQAVCAKGQQVWIAGALGGQVLYSQDGGQSWATQATPVQTPLRSITFVDSSHGWAVGTLGTIISTTDSGRTWRLQHGRSKRAAMLTVAATPERFPLETVCRYAAGDGYRVVAAPLFGASPESAALHDSHRAMQALSECGAELERPLWSEVSPAAGYQTSSDELLAELNRLTDNRAKQIITARVVRCIRTWRPDVVLVPHLRGSGTHAASAVLESLVLEAVAHAADPTYDVNLTAAGLPAWQVKRVVGSLEQGERGGIRLPNDDFVQALGGSPARFATAGRNLLHTSHTVAPAIDELELLWQVEGLPATPRELFSGLNIPTAGDARRPVVASDPRDLDRLRRLTQKRRQLVRLLDYAEGNPVWAAQAVNLTGGLDPQSGGELLFQLAQGYRETGRTAMAADSLYLLARRYPDHPLTEQSLVWLVRYYASGEAAHRASVQQAKSARGQPLANVPYASEQDATRNRLADGEVALPDDEGDGANSLTADERLERATALGKYLQTARPAVFAEPSLRFPLSVASRQLGFAATADKYFTVLGKSAVDSSWQRAALAERWLAEPGELPPGKPIATCRAVQQPPRLDGQFDEEIWTRAEPLRLDGEARAATGLQPQVQLCRDADYLYVAITCPKLPGENYPASEGPRTRDGDLSPFDRVQLSIDVDRDYGTAFEFTVDCRGWTHDACWGDASWQPKWYVAHYAGQTAEGKPTWQVEVAIPWAELATPEPAVLDTWAISAVRHTPRQGSTSWTGSANDSPDQFGLLLFR